MSDLVAPMPSSLKAAITEIEKLRALLIKERFIMANLWEENCNLKKIINGPVPLDELRKENDKSK